MVLVYKTAYVYTVGLTPKNLFIFALDIALFDHFEMKQKHQTIPG